MAKTYDFSDLTVLVVDDNSYMVSIVKTLLRGFGIHRIREASDAMLALDELRMSKVDVIIADCAMPTFNGIEFTRMVRTAKDSANPYVPIIMLTAYSERFRIEEARDAGITEMLRKPISAFDLYLRLIEVVEKPREFVKAGAFFGPDRRRRDHENFKGNDRRNVADPEADEGEESVADNSDAESANQQDIDALFG